MKGNRDDEQDVADEVDIDKPIYEGLDVNEAIKKMREELDQLTGGQEIEPLKKREPTESNSKMDVAKDFIESINSFLEKNPLTSVKHLEEKLEKEAAEPSAVMEFYDNAYAVDAMAGSGKTHAVIDLICKDTTQNYMYVAPSIQLLEQVRKGFADKGMTSRINVYHSDTHKQVGNQALGSINTTKTKSGQIIMTTHETFLRILPEIKRKQDWHVYIDEAVSVYDVATFKDEKHFTVLESLFEFTKDADGNAEIVVKSDSVDVVKVLGGYAPDEGQLEGKDSFKSKKIQDLCTVVAGTTQEQQVIGFDRDKGLLKVGSYVNPEPFKGLGRLTFMAANFEHTAFYHFWSKLFDIKFQPHAGIVSSLRNIGEQQGEYIQIGWLLEDGDSASHNALSKTIKGGLPARQKAIEIVRQYYKSKDYLLVLNNREIDDSCIPESKNKDEEIISTYVAGMNTYADKEAVAVIATTNPYPETAKWLKELLKIDNKEVLWIHQIHNEVQACGRIVRDPANTDKKTMIVLTKKAAEFLHTEVYPGSELLGKIGDLPQLKGQAGRPKKKSDHPLYGKLRNLQKKRSKWKKAGKDITKLYSEIEALEQEIEKDMRS